MSVETVIEDTRWVTADIDMLSDRAVLATLDCLGLAATQCSVSLLACDDSRIAALNGDFRDKPAATNVLSWPSEERGAFEDGGRPSPPTDPELGDIAIAYDTCMREATEQGKAFPDHTVHLLVHATLHLLGYDHIRPKDAELMESLEVEILARLGIGDPY